MATIAPAYNAPDTGDQIEAKLDLQPSQRLPAVNGVNDRAFAQKYVEAIERADKQNLLGSEIDAITTLIAGLRSANLYAGHNFRVLKGPKTIAGALLFGEGGTVTASNFSDSDIGENGIVSTGTNEVLTTDWAGSSEGQDDFCLSIYITQACTDSATNKSYFGNTTGSTTGSIQLNKNTSNFLFPRMKTNAGDTTTIVPSALTGFVSLSRDAAGTYRLRANGTTQTITRDSQSNISASLRFFSRAGDGFIDAGMSFIAYGPAMTEAETIRLENALTAYHAATPTGSLLASIGFGSDLHYGRKAPYSNRYPQDGDEKLEDAIATWDGETLDAVVLNGDLIDHESSESAEATADYTEVVTDANAMTPPAYYVLGNHEFDVLTRAQLLAINGQAAGNFTFDIGTTARVIVLDCSYGSDDDSDGWVPGVFNYLNSYVPPAQRTWLATTLDTTLPCLVFCHYRMTDKSAAHNIKNADDVRLILETANNVKGVFSGHSHVNNKTTINGVDYYVMQAMTEGADPTNAYAVLRLYANKLEITGYGGQTTYSTVIG